MNNFYDITKGQLISLWIFGVVAIFVLGDSSLENSGILQVLVPALLVFYTIGWKAKRKLDKHSTHEYKRPLFSKERKEKVKKIFKKMLPLLVIISFITVLIIVTVKMINFYSLKKDYKIAITQIESVEKEYNDCMDELNEERFIKQSRDCNLLKGKVKSEYDFCRSLSIYSRDYCLYENNYENIDCSRENLLKKAKVDIGDYMDNSCRESLNNLSKLKGIIHKYQSYYRTQ